MSLSLSSFLPPQAVTSRWLEEEADPTTTDDDSKPWGDVILASLLVQLVTLAGIFIWGATQLRNGNNNSDKKWRYFTHMVVPSFASGTLLATAVFLLLPEALLLIQGGTHAGHDDHDSHDSAAAAATADDDHSGHDHLLRFLQEEEQQEARSENQTAAVFGCAILAGFLLPILAGGIWALLFAGEATPVVVVVDQDEDDDKEHIDNDEREQDAEDPKGNETEKSLSTDGSPADDNTMSKNLPLAIGILLGDAFHNFSDGVFIGNALLLCDKSFAYAIVATTVYHELAQELADYTLLVHHCGFSPVAALVTNFAAGFSVWLGAIMVVSMDLSNTTTGFLLALSAGVYLYASCAECLPRVKAVQSSACDTIVFVLLFAVGAVPIGLVLLNHGHCEAAHGH